MSEAEISDGTSGCAFVKVIAVLNVNASTLLGEVGAATLWKELQRQQRLCNYLHCPLSRSRHKELHILPAVKGGKWSETFGWCDRMQTRRTSTSMQHRDGERDKVEPTTGFLSFNTPRPSFTAAHDGWRELVLHQLVNSLMYKSDPL